MHTRPRLVRSIPFWILVIVSLGATIGGALVVKIELDWMTTALTANTATGVDVYVGQIAAVVAGIVCGAGVIGLLLALTVASLAGLRATHGASAPVQSDADGSAQPQAEPVDAIAPESADTVEAEPADAREAEPAAR